ncbi:MAG: hypothetical protein KC503_10070 [Myxococcales bacterium]|nr:hypothetical protein [Myxococcales bacterium]
MDESKTLERQSQIRARALRAARAVALAGSITLGLAGCGARSTPGPQDAGPRVDVVRVDTTSDFIIQRRDAGRDVTTDGDPCSNGCGSQGCPCVGPFVPPEMPA